MILNYTDIDEWYFSRYPDKIYETFKFQEDIKILSGIFSNTKLCKYEQVNKSVICRHCHSEFNEKYSFMNIDEKFKPTADKCVATRKFEAVVLDYENEDYYSYLRDIVFWKPERQINFELLIEHVLKEVSKRQAILTVMINVCTLIIVEAILKCVALLANETFVSRTLILMTIDKYGARSIKCKMRIPKSTKVQ